MAVCLCGSYQLEKLPANIWNTHFYFIFRRETTENNLKCCSNNQHAISIAEEAIFTFHGIGIGIHSEILSHKSTDQHQ